MMRTMPSPIASRLGRSVSKITRPPRAAASCTLPAVFSNSGPEGAEEPPERRTAFGFAACWISGAAEDFAVALEMFPGIAAELWGENIDDLVQRLRAFGDAALQKANEARAFYDFLPAPSRRGRGDTHQLLFRDVATWVLKRLVGLHGGRFSQNDQDE